MLLIQRSDRMVHRIFILYEENDTTVNNDAQDPNGITRNQSRKRPELNPDVHIYSRQTQNPGTPNNLPTLELQLRNIANVWEQSLLRKIDKETQINGDLNAE